MRSTLQIDPSHVVIGGPVMGGPLWEPALEKLVRRVADSLGTNPECVQAKLYKLLLYQAGGFFDTHCDTEKKRGMFATLVVQLPSVFEGGEFVVRHGGLDRTYTLGTKDQLCAQVCHFVEHYADCEHAVRKVTSGYRLALVYSLGWTGIGSPPTA